MARAVHARVLLLGCFAVVVAAAGVVALAADPWRSRAPRVVLKPAAIEGVMRGVARAVPLPAIPTPGPATPVAVPPAPPPRDVPPATPGEPASPPAPSHPPASADPGGEPTSIPVPPADPGTPPVPSAPTPPVPTLVFRVTVLGADDLLEGANGRLAGLRLPSGLTLRLSSTTESAESAPPGLRVFVDADGLAVQGATPADPGDDPIGLLVPPLGHAGVALVGVRLPTGDAAREAALAALALVAGGDAASAAAVVKDAGDSPGVRILRAWSALARKEWNAVHEVIEGLHDHPDVGPSAHLLSGAALRADGNPREAVRDFETALARSEGRLVVARLLLAEAYDVRGLRLPDPAADAYAAAHAAMPDDVAAALGHARLLATKAKDLPGARRVVEAVLGRRPDLVAGWRLLGWVHAQADTDDDARAAVRALERAAKMRPAEPRSWGDLGGALWDWSLRGGGLDALTAAADAFGRQTEGAPDDARAWFNRGGTLHQAALDRPMKGDEEAFRSRLLEARSCYARALALGLGLQDAARVRFNLGLIADLLPGQPGPAGLPAAPADLFASAVEVDPSYAPAVFALAAARIVAGDFAGAGKALSSTPEGADATERGVLQAAAAYASGDKKGARDLLEGPTGMVVGPGDPRRALARTLLVFGHRRLVVALLDGPLGEPDLLGLRARARAGLRDLAGVKADLARLADIDPPTARDLREQDPDVRATLADDDASGS